MQKYKKYREKNHAQSFKTGSIENIFRNFIFLNIILTFASYWYVFFRFRKYIKGNQVKLLNSPAAVSSLLPFMQALLPLFILIEREGGIKRASPKTCQYRII